MNTTFQSKANRDAEYRRLKALGMSVTRYTSRNSLLHPMYVADFKGPEKDDTGFGNTVYKTHFSVLYHVAVERN